MASIVGLSKISMPRLEGLDTASARELRNYLYQMQEQLEYILSNIDTENLSGDLTGEAEIALSVGCADSSPEWVSLWQAGKSERNT